MVEALLEVNALTYQPYHVVKRNEWIYSILIAEAKTLDHEKMTLTLNDSPKNDYSHINALLMWNLFKLLALTIPVFPLLEN